MGISYFYNDREGYLEIKCEGVMSVEEIITARTKMFSDNSIAAGAPELVDLSDADFSMISPSAVQQIAEETGRIFKEHAVEHVKIAFYTTDYLSSVMVSLYGEFVQDGIEETRIFGDRGDAQAWLKADAAEMSYTIEPDRNLVLSRYGGYIRAKDLIAHIKTIREDPDFHDGLNTIADIRTARLPDIYAEIMALVNFIKASVQERGDFRLALIIEKQTTSKLAVVYEAMAAENHVKLCYDMAEAQQWANA